MIHMPNMKGFDTYLCILCPWKYWFLWFLWKKSNIWPWPFDLWLTSGGLYFAQSFTFLYMIHMPNVKGFDTYLCILCPWKYWFLWFLWKNPIFDLDLLTFEWPWIHFGMYADNSLWYITCWPNMNEIGAWLNFWDKKMSQFLQKIV